MHPSIINMFLLAFFAFPANAADGLAPLSAKLQYQASFGGLLLGNMGLEVEQKPESASVTLDAVSAGVVKIFVKHSSHTTLTASGSQFSYPDRTYESNYRTRKKARHVKLVYKAGEIVESLVEPAEDPAKRPPIPDAEKNSAYDLMAFLLQMRIGLHNALNTHKTAFTLKAFDGRRLSQANFAVLGERTMTYNGEKRAVVAVNVKRKQLAGFTKDEVAAFNPNEPALTIYFTKDERMIPLAMEFPFMLQKITVMLVKECGAAEGCLLGNDS